MEGFSIVEKALKSNGYSPDYIETQLKENPYGKKFYSNGTYTEDMYDLDKNKLYLIGVKSSGRKLITLYDKKTKNLIESEMSQKDFVNMLIRRQIIKREIKWKRKEDYIDI